MMLLVHVLNFHLRFTDDHHLFLPPSDLLYSPQISNHDGMHYNSQDYTSQAMPLYRNGKFCLLAVWMVTNGTPILTPTTWGGS